MKVIKYILGIFLLPLLSACSQIGSIDDIKPEHVLTDESLFSNASSTEAFANGMYQLWRSPGICNMRNCMFMLNGECEQSSFADRGFQSNDIDSRSNFVENYYTSLYLVVNHANTIISGLSATNPKELTQERKEEILGEAYFNRAFANMMLLKSFGQFWDHDSKYGIVLYDEPVTGNTAKARSSVADCYDLIASDIDKAIEMTPEYSGKSYYATKASAKALKARLQLYTQDYAGAASTCEDIITTGHQTGLELETDYMDIFNKKLNSTEPILTVFTSYPQERITNDYGVPSVFYDYNAYLGTMLMQVADSLVGELYDWDWDDMTHSFDNRFYRAFIEDDGQQMNSTINKYPISDGMDDNTYYFIRLAEIYLIKAEAEARLGKYNEARESLKPITDRAGYAADYVYSIPDDELLNKIFDHKYVELCAENYESWYDIVRHYVLDGDDYTAYRYRVKLTHLVLPIPYQAMAGNGALEQNPDYVRNLGE